METWIITIIWLVSVLVTTSLAMSKGQGVEGFVLGLLLGPIGVFVALASGASTKQVKTVSAVAENWAPQSTPQQPDYRQTAERAIKKRRRDPVQWLFLGALSIEIFLYASAATRLDHEDKAITEILETETVVSLLSTLPEATMVNVVGYQRAYWSLPDDLADNPRRKKARELVINNARGSDNYRAQLLIQIRRVTGPGSDLFSMISAAKQEYIENIHSSHLGRIICLIILWPFAYWAAGVHLWGSKKYMEEEADRQFRQSLPILEPKMLEESQSHGSDAN